MSVRVDTSYISFTAKNTKQTQLIDFTDTINILSTRIHQRQIVPSTTEQSGERLYDIFLGSEAEDLFFVEYIIDQFPVTVIEKNFDENGEQTITNFSLTGKVNDVDTLRLMPVIQDSRKRVYDMFTMGNSGPPTITADLFIKRIEQTFTLNDLKNTLVNITAEADLIGYDVVTLFRNGKILGYDIFVLIKQQP